MRYCTWGAGVVQTLILNGRLPDAVPPGERRYALKAYGRPLTDLDRQTLRDLYARGSDNGQDFEAGIELGLARILSGPEFLLYHGVSEEGAVAEGDRQDDGVTLASRLALFLWNRLRPSAATPKESPEEA